MKGPRDHVKHVSCFALQYRCLIRVNKLEPIGVDQEAHVSIEPTTTTDNVTVVSGQVPNGHDLQNPFANYAENRSAKTLQNQQGDLAAFAKFLLAAGIPEHLTAHELMTTPAAWRNVSFDIVESFRNWLVESGYAPLTCNIYLSTVKVYANLATKAGVLSTTELARIKGVQGFGRKAAKKVNNRRTVTRINDKKTEHIALTDAQADQLKRQPDTPQGRCDAVIMALLLEHGLRVGELAALEVSAFNLQEKTYTFYRKRIHKTQTHKLTADSFTALAAWLGDDGGALKMGPLLRRSRKGGRLTDSGMNESAITSRIRALGAAINVGKLSANDLRHYWATRAAQQGMGLFDLQEAGGWSSPEIPRRYIEEARVTNAVVDLWGVDRGAVLRMVNNMRNITEIGVSDLDTMLDG